MMGFICCKGRKAGSIVRIVESISREKRKEKEEKKLKLTKLVYRYRYRRLPHPATGFAILTSTHFLLFFLFTLFTPNILLVLYKILSELATAHHARH